MTAGFQFPDVDEHYGSPEDPDLVNHPAHYQTDNGLEVIDVIEAYGLGFHRGNAVKYILRAGKKDEYTQELEKARWYLDREIERVKND